MYSSSFIYLLERETEREIKVRIFELCVHSPHLNMIFHVQVFLVIYLFIFFICKSCLYITGFALPVAIVAKCEEKMFLAQQKISFS